MSVKIFDSFYFKSLIGAVSVIGGGIACVAAYRTFKPGVDKALTASSKDSEIYETEQLLNAYLTFHYGGPEVNCLHSLGVKNCFDFPVRCAELCVKHFQPLECSVERALDIGCAVGRSTFELSKTFRESIGIDFSFGFSRTCELLAKNGHMEYETLVEGDLTTKHIAKIPEDVDTSRCSFRQGDACNLPLDIGQFGCVLAANLICRLPDPKVFLMRLKNIVAQGGICVITSPYTFLRDFTPRNKWIGGFKDLNGREIRAFDAMKEILSPEFELIAVEDMPFLIRETARKHQLTVAHATVWKRRTIAAQIA